MHYVAWTAEVSSAPRRSTVFGERPGLRVSANTSKCSDTLPRGHTWFVAGQMVTDLMIMLHDIIIEEVLLGSPALRF